MTSARYRCSSLLMAKDQFTSRIPTSRYDSSTYTKANLAQRPIADIWRIKRHFQSIMKVSWRMLKLFSRNFRRTDGQRRRRTDHHWRVTLAGQNKCWFETFVRHGEGTEGEGGTQEDRVCKIISVNIVNRGEVWTVWGLNSWPSLEDLEGGAGTPPSATIDNEPGSRRKSTTRTSWYSSARQTENTWRWCCMSCGISSSTATSRSRLTSRWRHDTSDVTMTLVLIDDL